MRGLGKGSEAISIRGRQGGKNAGVSLWLQQKRVWGYAGTGVVSICRPGARGTRIKNGITAGRSGSVIQRTTYELRGGGLGNRNKTATGEIYYWVGTSAQAGASSFKKLIGTKIINSRTSVVTASRASPNATKQTTLPKKNKYPPEAHGEQSPTGASSYDLP